MALLDELRQGPMTLERLKAEVLFQLTGQGARSFSECNQDFETLTKFGLLPKPESGTFAEAWRACEREGLIEASQGDQNLRVITVRGLSFGKNTPQRSLF